MDEIDEEVYYNDDNLYPVIELADDGIADTENQEAEYEPDSEDGS